MKTVIPELDEYLASIPAGEPLTPEELLLCLPYSETRQWVRLLVLEYACGGLRVQGPPGLWQVIEPWVAHINGRDKIDLYFEPDAVVDAVMRQFGPQPDREGARELG